MPRKGVQYVQNEEPSFIRQFKEKVGHKDGPDVNTKRQIPNFSDDEDEENVEEKEDEKPMVVVLKEGDLTAEEATSELKQIDEGPARLDEKITFKKPVKRTKEAAQDDEEEGKTEDIKKKKPSKDSKKKKENKSLLSFGDDEEEDD
ncbi:uncharacterized protein KIAA1143 homolog [Aplysia californica]|uniref:Uncharacterized protein KIAA1143 homolog n=1 Tax=Aplysia californica TaxID=6500 RepID=A0ABM0K0B1_APLCA|nr:uncharacterized protein KIAA1143 homolog [Aplysia californica]